MCRKVYHRIVFDGVGSFGGANLAAGLADAYMGLSPVIAMTGAIPAEHRYRHGYQEYEHSSPFDAVAKSSFQVERVERVERLPDSLRQAFREATSGSPGPVHLDIRDEATYASGRIAVLDMVSDIEAMAPQARQSDVRASAFA